MQVYVALLRGINVSGQKKIKMVDLVALFQGLGCVEVQTYIQSGNVIFKRIDGDEYAFAKAIQEKIKSVYNFEVPVVILKAEKVVKIFNDCPFDQTLKESSYFTMLHEPPLKNALKEATWIDLREEQFAITKDCVYLFAPKGYGRAKGNNNFFERKLRVKATTRNYKTMMKLVNLSS